MIKLSANENFYGCSPSVKKTLAENLDSVHFYPDYHQQNLKNRIAELNAVNAANVMLGVGVVGIIDAITRLLVKPDEEIITFERSFVAYGQLANLYNKKIHFAPLDDFSCNTNNIFPFINNKTKVIFIANPNNPTGTIIGHQSLEKFIAEVSKDIYIVIDEAYFEYATEVCFPHSMQLMEKHSNVIVLRGFSKAYGIAGLRIGYGIANENMASFFESNRLPYSINSLSAIAAMTAIADNDFIKECVQKNAVEREFLYQEIKAAGYNILRSEGNFLFMYFEDEDLKDSIHKRLADEGIMVCNLKVFAQDSSLRIGVADRPTNTRIVSILGSKIRV